MARRHNTILITEDVNLLGGVTVPRCPGGCGQLATRCACPPRDIPPAVTAGRCPGCRYLVSRCTCPGGPRGR